VSSGAASVNGNHFDLIILIGRPAAGKSEVIDFLRKTSLPDRLRRFHVSQFEEFDDFPYVWETFEIDDILSRHKKNRLSTDEQYWFKDPFIWNLFIERINLAYRKKLAGDRNYHASFTSIVEFSRGGEHGFEEAFSYLHEEILKRAGIIYIKVSYEESVRKNRRRARPGMEGSVLYHSLPDDKMETYYKINDWDALASHNPEFITVNGYNVPYAVFQNEPEKTDNPAALGDELERATGRLWKLKQSR